MRYRQPRGKKQLLSQFFTPADVADVVARSLEVAPRDILELGAGQGALVDAVLSLHPRATATLVEIDPDLVRVLRRKYRGHRVIAGDVIDEVDALPLSPSYGTVLGNPPFGVVPLESPGMFGVAKLLPELGPRWVRQDLVFLYESWKRVTPGGQLALILGSPLIKDPAYAKLRRWLLSECSSASICELPERAFVGAEVESYLLMLRHRGRRRRLSEVELSRVDTPEGSRQVMRVSVDEAIDRMDYRFHSIRTRAGQRWKGATNLATIGAAIVRGSRSHGDFQLDGIQHIHTTDFTDQPRHMRLGRCDVDHLQRAERGDVLVPRVGTRCLMREALVISGARPISEAVLRIRVDAKDRTRVFDALTSDAGRLWRQAHARGSCAKYMAVSDLRSFPLG